MLLTKASCITHLDPGLISAILIARLAAAIDLLPLAGRAKFVATGSLPVLHFDGWGGRKKRGGRGGNRHVRWRQSGCGGGGRDWDAIKRWESCLRLAWASSMHHELVMPEVLALRWSSNKRWVSTGGV